MLFTPYSVFHFSNYSLVLFIAAASCQNNTGTRWEDLLNSFSALISPVHLCGTVQLTHGSMASSSFSKLFTAILFSQCLLCCMELNWPQKPNITTSKQQFYETVCLQLVLDNELTRDDAKFSRKMERAASTAPPPGTTDFDSSTRFTTHSASWTDRSISSHMKSLAPRSTMLAAVLTFGLHCCHMHADKTDITTQFIRLFVVTLLMSGDTFCKPILITKRYDSWNYTST